MNDVTPQLPAGSPADPDDGATDVETTDQAPDGSSPVASPDPSQQPTTEPQRLLPADEVAIDVRDLSHRFGNHLAVERVSFQVTPRSLHGFVGPNGAGKTTVLKLICTLLRPQSGSVHVHGKDVDRQTKEVRRQIGFMPDHFSMYRQMTVTEYLDFFAAAYGLNVTDRQRVIGDVLALTDMDGRRDSLISGLSRGMQQRVGLARVLVNDPDLLLLDEPASGLDPRARIELMEILRALRQMGKTIFISSHILSELAELCDSVTIIDRGHIRYSGGMRDLLEQDSDAAVYRLTLAEEQPGIEDRLLGLDEVMSAERIEESLEFRIRCNPGAETDNRLLAAVLGLEIPVESFQKDLRHLNEAFMDLTEQGVR